VIEAFNSDRPYARFILEQLAGDSVAEVRATGFLMAKPALLPGQIGKDQESKARARQDELNDMVTTTGAADPRALRRGRPRSDQERLRPKLPSCAVPAQARRALHPTVSRRPADGRPRGSEMGRAPALKVQYDIHGAVFDQPAAALVGDLRERGLLEDTLVVWATEFGRMPTFQKGASGRDHNPDGFTVWMTGAGVKRGFSFGATDDLGYNAVQNITTIYDLHATMLHLLGLDHERLTYYHNGIERRLTDVHGHVIKETLS